jgi:hypothetical protein
MIVAAAGSVTLQATAAEAAVPHYKNCTAVHKVYSGGIAKKSVTVNTIHHRNGTVTKAKLKGTVKHDDSLYNANKGLDADHDGIACELD